MLPNRPGVVAQSGQGGGVNPAPQIMIVEDEHDVAFLLQWHLRQAGFGVTLATSGWAALELIRENRPDLILLDLMLPDLDGFGVCEILRRDPATALIPVVILSAWTMDESKRVARDYGVLDYLTKPFRPALVVQRLRELTGFAQPVQA